MCVHADGEKNFFLPFSPKQKGGNVHRHRNSSLSPFVSERVTRCFPVSRTKLFFRFLLVQITEGENKFSKKRRIWGNCIQKSKARSEFQKSINALPHAATTKASILSLVFFKDGREETSGEISDIPSFLPFPPEDRILERSKERKKRRLRFREKGKSKAACQSQIHVRYVSRCGI